jgi:hypothetical protein
VIPADGLARFWHSAGATGIRSSAPTESSGGAPKEDKLGREWFAPATPEVRDELEQFRKLGEGTVVPQRTQERALAKANRRKTVWSSRNREQLRSAA